MLPPEAGQFDRMIEQATKAIDDGKTETEAARLIPIGTGEPVELPKDGPVSLAIDISTGTQ